MYEISYSNGTSTLATTYKTAIAAIKADYPAAITGPGRRGPVGDRTFCWANEDDAVNDDGANAIATITRVHDADA